MNGSRLRVDGTFPGRLEVNGVGIEMEFYSVPSDTMAFDVLLGRDFLSCPRLYVTFGETIGVANAEEARAINSVMHVGGGDGFTRARNELKGNPAVDVDASARVDEARR